MTSICKKCQAELKTMQDGRLVCPVCQSSGETPDLLPPVATPPTPAPPVAAPPISAPPVEAPPFSGPPVAAVTDKQSSEQKSKPPIAAPPVVGSSAAAPPVVSPPDGSATATNPPKTDSADAANSGGDPPPGLLPPVARSGDSDSVSNPSPSAGSAKPPVVANDTGVGSRKNREGGKTESSSVGKASAAKQKAKDTTGGGPPDSAPNLLPPSAAEDRDEALLPPSVKPKSSGLLPPIASGDPASGDQAPDNEASPESESFNAPPRVVAEAAEEDGPVVVTPQEIDESERVLIPDGEGGFVEVSERRTQIEYRGTKIELESMNREEKNVVRTWHNFIVALICVAFLIGLMLLLNWLNGGGQ